MLWPSVLLRKLRPPSSEISARKWVCSPSNPQGRVASADYVRKALALARKHDFMLFFDECYSEIYSKEPPTGGLQVAAETPERFKNIGVFNSLSKRSNLPGLRSGLAAGDPDFLETMAEMRNLTAPQMPGIVQHAEGCRDHLLTLAFVDTPLSGQHAPGCRRTL